MEEKRVQMLVHLPTQVHKLLRINFITKNAIFGH